MNHEKVIVRMRKMINACALSANVEDLRQMLYDLVDLVEHLFKLHAPPAVELHTAVNPRNVCCRCGLKSSTGLGVCDGKVMCYDCWSLVGGWNICNWPKWLEDNYDVFSPAPRIYLRYHGAGTPFYVDCYAEGKARLCKYYNGTDDPIVCELISFASAKMLFEMMGIDRRKA